MGSCADFGELYAYFLEVCRHFIYEKLHQELGVPELGREMYVCLRMFVYEIYGQPYEIVLSNSGFLSEEDRGFLSPENRIIDTANLDVNMHFKIMRLLKPRRRNWCWSYIARVRNYLCHIPVQELQQNMDRARFRDELSWLKRELNYAGIDNNLLDVCQENILRGRQ